METRRILSIQNQSPTPTPSEMTTNTSPGKKSLPPLNELSGIKREPDRRAISSYFNNKKNKEDFSRKKGLQVLKQDTTSHISSEGSTRDSNSAFAYHSVNFVPAMTPIASDSPILGETKSPKVISRIERTTEQAEESTPLMDLKSVDGINSKTPTTKTSINFYTSKKLKEIEQYALKDRKSHFELSRMTRNKNISNVSNLRKPSEPSVKHRKKISSKTVHSVKPEKVAHFDTPSSIAQNEVFTALDDFMKSRIERKPNHILENSYFNSQIEPCDSHLRKFVPPIRGRLPSEFTPTSLTKKIPDFKNFPKISTLSWNRQFQELDVMTPQRGGSVFQTFSSQKKEPGPAHPYHPGRKKSQNSRRLFMQRGGELYAHKLDDVLRKTRDYFYRRQQCI